VIMRKTDIIVRIIRIIGVVLLILFLTFSLYDFSISSSAWSEMETSLEEAGADTNFADRIEFDHDYYLAMANARSSETQGSTQRRAEAMEYFESFRQKAADAAEEKKAADAAEVIPYLAQSYDYAEFLESYSQRENVLETASAREELEAINTLLTPTSIGGKKLPSLETASAEDDLTAAYEELTDEYGDEAGTWLEYLTVVHNEMQDYIDGGGSLVNFSDYQENVFDADTYFDDLAEVMETEDQADATSFLADFADFVEQHAVISESTAEAESAAADETAAAEAESAAAADAEAESDAGTEELTGSAGAAADESAAEETAEEAESAAADSGTTGGTSISVDSVTVTEDDLQTFLSEELAKIQEAYPSEDLSDEDAYLLAVQTLLDSGSSFDGSFAAVVSEYENQTDVTGTFDSFLSDFADEVVDSADERKNIGFVSFFWTVVANNYLNLVFGIVCLVAAAVIRKIMNTALLKKEKEDEIPDDPDVLLRVDHLKQYFRSGSYINKAVDDVSFYIKKGEVFGLVGESGCGKTTTGRTIINLYDPTDGTVTFHGMRVSSTKNGVKVNIASMRKDAADKMHALKQDLDEAVRKDPSKAAELRKKYRKDCAEIKKNLNDEIGRKELEALKSEAAKQKSISAYREQQLAELKKKYDEDMKSLTGDAAKNRTKLYKDEKKAISKTNSIMTRMQMIFQDPIASIDPRMTVREIIAEGLRIRGITDQKYIDQKVYEMLERVGLVREHADRYPHEFSGGQRQRIGIARAIVMEPDLIIADEPISALDVSIQAQIINLLNDLRNQMSLTILFIAHNLSVVKYFSDRIAVMYFGKIVELADSDELFRHPLHPYTKSLLSAIPYPDPHYEKQRKRIEYDPETAHDYSTEKPVMREILPGHFILCNTAEFEQYKIEIEKIDARDAAEAKEA
jgi:oligopeptide transport system ATP-binding protein